MNTNEDLLGRMEIPRDLWEKRDWEDDNKSFRVGNRS